MPVLLTLKSIVATPLPDWARTRSDEPVSTPPPAPEPMRMKLPPLTVQVCAALRATRLPKTMFIVELAALMPFAPRVSCRLSAPTVSVWPAVPDIAPNVMPETVKAAP